MDYSGKRLLEERHRRGLSQMAIAVRARCSPATLVAIEKHGFRPCRLTQRRIAKALGVGIRALWPVNGEEKGPEDAA